MPLNFPQEAQTLKVVQAFSSLTEAKRGKWAAIQRL